MPVLDGGVTPRRVDKPESGQLQDRTQLTRIDADLITENLLKKFILTLGTQLHSRSTVARAPGKPRCRRDNVTSTPMPWNGLWTSPTAVVSAYASRC